MSCSIGISNFLEEISSLSPSIVFLYFFALITEEGFLISPILWNSAFRCLYLSFLLPSFPQLFVRLPHPDSHFDFLHFFSVGMVSIPVSCTMSRTSSLPLYIHMGLDLSHTLMVIGFPYFLQFKSEFCNKELMI